MRPLEALEALRVPLGCLSELQIQRLDAGDLDAPDEARAHAAGCSGCAARLAGAAAERAAFRASPPWRLPPANRRRWLARPGLVAAIGAAAAAALVIVWILPRDPRGAPGPERGTQLKGGVRFELFAARGDHVLPLAQGDRVRPGDRIQVVYSAAVATHVAVLSRDGAGALGVYFPVDRATTWPAAAGQEVGLPSSTELDASLGAETLYLVACAAAQPLAALRVAVDDAARPPSGCTIDRIDLVKEPLR